MAETAGTRQSPAFLLLYALAAAGGAIAYVPFLTILLPMQVSDLVGDADAQVAWLASATFAGAMSASLANILFGWLSDRTGSRRPWMLAGLIASCLLLVAFGQVSDIRWIIALLVLWQIALNMMLSPLAAWAGDCVPDRQKGFLGGLLAFSPAAGALATAFITIPGLADETGRLWLVAAIVAVCVLPAILVAAPRPFPELVAENDEAIGSAEQESHSRYHSRYTVIRMWLARLLIQISEAALFAFLYFWFRSVDSTMSDSSVAQIFSLILIVSVPIALRVGTWSDRRGRPFLPLTISAAIGACGLVIMAYSHSLVSAVIGYAVFGLATSVFLALHTGQTLRVLPKPQNRGRDLGIFNLTNTSPSLVMPWLTIGLVPLFGFSGLFIALAGCAFAATLLLASISSRR